MLAHNKYFKSVCTLKNKGGWGGRGYMTRKEMEGRNVLKYKTPPGFKTPNVFFSTSTIFSLGIAERTKIKVAKSMGGRAADNDCADISSTDTLHRRGS